MAILLMLMASACFVTMAALVKAMGDSLPLTELMFLRSLLAVPFLFAIQLKNHKPLIATGWKILLIRSMFGILAMFCFYYALTNMPLADCVFLGRTQPLILSLLAPFLVGEKTPKSAWSSIALGIIGAVLIMRPSFSWSTAALVALIASASSAVAHLMVRRLGRTDDPGVIVFNFTLIMAIASGIACAGSFVVPGGYQWFYLIGIAVLASCGQYLLTMAYARDRAPAVAAASYSSVILSILYGYFFWNEMPSFLSILGGAFIVGGGFILMKSRLHVSEPARK